MGRKKPFAVGAARIACACALVMLGARAALAQTTNDDRYGFSPVPGLSSAPTTPVNQAPLGPPQNYPPQNYGPVPQNGVVQTGAPQNAQGYLPPPQPMAQSQNFQPPLPTQMGAMQAPMQAPMQASMQAPAGFVQAPPQPYGYAPMRDQNGGYIAQGASAYGTQVATNPGAYYAASGNGMGGVSGYMLGPGDKVRVSVFGEDDLSGEYQIDSSGMIRLPLIGTLRAAGFTAAALENSVAGALAQGYLKSPRVNVEISAYRPIYVIGAVNRPGEYAYVANMTALNAVAFGGGFTDQAKQSVVYVRHEGSVEEQELPADQMTRVWPGDVIRVKPTVFWSTMSIFSPLAGPAALAAATIR